MACRPRLARRFLMGVLLSGACADLARAKVVPYPDETPDDPHATLKLVVVTAIAAAVGCALHRDRFRQPVATADPLSKAVALVASVLLVLGIAEVEPALTGGGDFGLVLHHAFILSGLLVGFAVALAWRSSWTWVASELGALAALATTALGFGWSLGQAGGMLGALALALGMLSLLIASAAAHRSAPEAAPRAHWRALRLGTALSLVVIAGLGPVLRRPGGQPAGAMGRGVQIWLT